MLCAIASSMFRKGLTSAAALLALTAIPARADAPLPGVFVPAGELAQADDLITATALPDGGVLTCDSTTCQRFSPSAGTWSNPLVMQDQHVEHTATALLDGRVLIAGTAWNTTNHPSAELFDPVTDRFSTTGAMVAPRFGAAALRLQSGEVLIAGGRDTLHGSVPMASAEIYSPTSGTFRSTGSMASTREGFTATLLSDGRVLVTGGVSATGGFLASAEIYSPATGTFATVAGGMTQPRYEHAAVLLADGRVLIAGGWSYYYSSTRPVASAEIFDPSTNTFSALSASMTDSREGLAMALLPSGLVLAAAGFDAHNEVLNNADVFDPASGSFTRLPTTLQVAAESPATALLADGRVLVAGGASGNGGFVASASLFVPDRVFAEGFEAAVGSSP